LDGSSLLWDLYCIELLVSFAAIVSFGGVTNGQKEEASNHGMSIFLVGGIPDHGELLTTVAMVSCARSTGYHIVMCEF
jgi:hypothetical protein